MRDGRPTVPQMVPLLRAYYAKPGNGNGGSLHIVLEDGNVGSGHVASCINYAAREHDEDGVQLGEMLLKMTTTQRKKLARKAFYPWIAADA